MRKLIGLIITIVLVTGLLATACGSPAVQSPAATTASPTATATTSEPRPTPQQTATTAVAAPQVGGTLKILPGAGPGSPFGWPVQSVGAGVYLVELAFDTLIRADKLGNFEPELATSWDIAPDGKSITFHLRKGVKFHDGTDFNAEAVKFYFDEVKAAKHSSAQTWTSIDVIDDDTVRVNLSRWENITMIRMAGTGDFIPSPAAFKTRGLDGVRWNAVGTGAFRQVSFTRDVEATFERFDGYWQNGKPYVDQVKYIFITDATTSALSFSKGEAQVLFTSEGGASDIRATLDKIGFKYLTAGTTKGLGGPTVLVPDSANADSPFAAQKVREALEYAIDREAVKNLGRGEWEAPYQVAPAKSWAYNPALESRYRKYDPKKAKELLAEAGFPGGFKTKIYTASSATRDQLVPVVQYLKDVGIEAAVELVTLPKFTELQTKGWRDSLMAAGLPQGTAPFVGPIAVNWWSGQWYPSLKKSDKFKELYTGVLTTVPVDKQKTLSVEMNTVMFDEAMVIPLWRTEPGPVAGPFYVDGVRDAGFNYGQASPFWKPENVWLEKKARLGS